MAEFHANEQAEDFVEALLADDRFRAQDLYGRVWRALEEHLSRVNTISIFQGSATQSVNHNTTTTMNYSNGAGAFTAAPTMNYHNFAPGAGGDAGVYVPRPGIYRVGVTTVFGASATDPSQRYADILDGTTALGGIGGVDRNYGYPSASATPVLFAEVLHGFEEGRSIGTRAYQNSGAALSVTAYLTAEWIAPLQRT